MGQSDPVKPLSVVRLDRTPGVHAVTVHVGDVLLFETSYYQSGSTGYSWRGPEVTGNVFDKPGTLTSKGPDFGKPRKPLPPGAPEPAVRRTFSTVKVVKVGKGTLKYAFVAPGGRGVAGQPECLFRVAVVK